MSLAAMEMQNHFTEGPSHPSERPVAQKQMIADAGEKVRRKEPCGEVGGRGGGGDVRCSHNGDQGRSSSRNKR